MSASFHRYLPNNASPVPIASRRKSWTVSMGYGHGPCGHVGKPHPMPPVNFYPVSAPGAGDYHLKKTPPARPPVAAPVRRVGFALPSTPRSAPPRPAGFAPLCTGKTSTTRLAPSAWLRRPIGFGRNHSAAAAEEEENTALKTLQVPSSFARPINRSIIGSSSS
uniref:Uncharacterized protein n=1 Tax=Oryza rufipogon TaxID=4529 RepID=A0A0E0NXQ2_ORYRU